MNTIVTYTSPDMKRNNLKYDSRLVHIQNIFEEIKGNRTDYAQLKLDFNLSVLYNLEIIGYKQTFFNDNLNYRQNINNIDTYHNINDEVSRILSGTENLLDIDPNKFEFFLFIVLLFGIKFSSLSLKTVASFNSK